MLTGYLNGHRRNNLPRRNVTIASTYQEMELIEGALGVWRLRILDSFHMSAGGRILLTGTIVQDLHFLVLPTFMYTVVGLHVYLALH